MSKLLEQGSRPKFFEGAIMHDVEQGSGHLLRNFRMKHLLSSFTRGGQRSDHRWVESTNMHPYLSKWQAVVLGREGLDLGMAHTAPIMSDRAVEHVHDAIGGLPKRGVNILEM